MPAVTKKYSDIDLSFVPHPISGDITILRDSNAVQRSLMNLMMMGEFDRPFERDLGANLKQLLYENMTPLTENAIDMQIRSSIARYEPRVTVAKLEVVGEPDNNRYRVKLTYIIDSLSETRTIDTFLQRVR